MTLAEFKIVKALLTVTEPFELRDLVRTQIKSVRSRELKEDQALWGPIWEAASDALRAF